MNNDEDNLVHEGPEAELPERQPNRPPLPPTQSYDPFGSLFDDRWVNDDF